MDGVRCRLSKGLAVFTPGGSEVSLVTRFLGRKLLITRVIDLSARDVCLRTILRLKGIYVGSGWYHEKRRLDKRRKDLGKCFYFDTILGMRSRITSFTLVSHFSHRG